MSDKADMERRIDKLFSQDRLMAGIFVVALWVTYAFVFFGIDQFIPEAGVRYVLLVAGALVVFFNTASVVAMIRHYGEDKHFIYEIDIKHLDEMKANK